MTDIDALLYCVTLTPCEQRLFFYEACTVAYRWMLHLPANVVDFEIKFTKAGHQSMPARLFKSSPPI